MDAGLPGDLELEPGSRPEQEPEPAVGGGAAAGASAARAAAHAATATARDDGKILIIIGHLLLQGTRPVSDPT